MSQSIPSLCPFEHIQDPAKENAQITQTADLTVKLLGKRYPAPAASLRGVHPKAHGSVMATFTVNADLPPALRVGLFAAPGKAFRAVIRFSNATNLISSDTDTKGNQSSRGMAIKVMDVGQDIMVSDVGANNQDFLMINQPSFAFANAEDYLRLTKVLDRNNDTADGFFAPLQANNPQLPQAVRDGIAAYMKAEAMTPAAVGRTLDTFKIVQQIQHMIVANPLGTQYFSAAPFLFGPDRVMKFSAKPCQAVQPTQVPNPPPPNYLTDSLTQTMAQTGALQFDFMIQVRGGTADMGVENASSVWDETQFPFVAVAKITIQGPQISGPTTPRAALLEQLAFSPWHCLPDHQPIGSINRLRKAVYAASSAKRQAQSTAAQVARR